MTVRFPVSFLQEWLVEASGSGRSDFNVPVVVTLPPGPVDRARLQGALDALVARHEALRTTLERTGADGALEQHVHAPGPLPIREIDDDGPDALRDELAAPFDLLDARLVRAALLPRRRLVALTLHHAIADGGSASVLAGELTRLLAEDAPALPELAIQFGDYAAWERSFADPALLAWWAAALRPAPAPLRLPGARTGPVTTFRTTPRPLPPVAPEVARALARLAARHRTTLPAVLGAAAIATLAPYAGDAITVGVTVSNRHRPELRHVVGYLSDQLPVRVDLSGAPSFGELLERFDAGHAEALAHQAPLGALAPLLRRDGDAPLLDVIVNVLPDGPDGASGPAIARERFVHTVDAWWDGSALVDLQPRPSATGGPGGHLVANEAALDVAAVAALAASYGATLQRVADGAQLAAPTAAA
jgi:Condensation domain